MTDLKALMISALQKQMTETARLMDNSKTMSSVKVSPPSLQVAVAKPDFNFDKVSSFAISTNPMRLEVDLE